jgi:hypothetical protein
MPQCRVRRRQPGAVHQCQFAGVAMSLWHYPGPAMPSSEWRQQCLYFFPLPQWHGSLTPGRGAATAGVLVCDVPLRTGTLVYRSNRLARYLVNSQSYERRFSAGHSRCRWPSFVRLCQFAGGRLRVPDRQGEASASAVAAPRSRLFFRTKPSVRASHTRLSPRNLSLGSASLRIARRKGSDVRRPASPAD